VKGTDNNRKKRNLKPCLIIAGILFTLIALGAVAMSIYLFLFISKTMTTTTSKNKVLF
jgi:flagellar basal body-associated protein FliL